MYDSKRVKDSNLNHAALAQLAQLRERIMVDLARIGQISYEAVMAGTEPNPELTFWIMKSLPSGLAGLDQSLNQLDLIAQQAQSILKQIEAGESLDFSTLPESGGGHPYTPMNDGVENPDCGDTADSDVQILKEMLQKNLQIAAWYGIRAHSMGADLSEYQDGFIVGLQALADQKMGLGGMLSRVMESGQLVYVCAASLNEIKNVTLGESKITTVSGVPAQAATLIVDGPDTEVLKDVLLAADQHGIDVYTSGEMGAAHGYSHLSSHQRLRGHVHLQDQKSTSLPVRGTLLCTGIAPSWLEFFSDGKIMTTGFSRFAGAEYIQTLSDEKADKTFWKLAAEGNSETVPSGTDLFQSGWGYSALMERRQEILQQLVDGDIKSLDIVISVDEMTGGTQWKNQSPEKDQADAHWLLIAGCPMPDQPNLESNESLPNPLYLGAVADVFNAVSFLLSLSYELHCGLDQLPYRFVFPTYREDLVGVWSGLMSLGLKGFYLHRSWRDQVTDRVWELLSEKCRLFILDETNHEEA